LSEVWLLNFLRLVYVCTICIYIENAKK
jgi:hypothetical protein